VRVRRRGQQRCAGTRSDSGAWRLQTEARGHRVPLWHGATAVPPRTANPGAARGGLAADMRPHMSANFKY
jgi:hypothetical protein